MGEEVLKSDLKLQHFAAILALKHVLTLFLCFHFCVLYPEGMGSVF